MTKAEQLRQVTFRSKFLQHAKQIGNVSATCRFFGISREKFYKWKKRFDELGAAGLADRPTRPHHSPNATPKAVVSKVLYLRQNYHFGAGRIRDFEALPSGPHRRRDGPEHPAKARGGQASCEPEAPAARQALDSLREANAGSPPSDGREVPRAHSWDQEAALPVHRNRRLHPDSGAQDLRRLQSGDCG